MPGSTNKTFHLLCAAMGMIVAWLCVRAVLPDLMAEDSAVVKEVLIVLIFVLMSMLLIVKLLNMKQQALQKSERSREKIAMQRLADKAALRYQSLMEGAGDAIFVIHAKTGLLEEMNDMGTVLLGYTREEMGTLKGKALVAKSDRARFASLVRRVNHRGIAASDSLTFLHKEGTQFVGEVKARLIDLGDEKVVQAMVRDVTHKKQNELEIRNRNRKLSVLNSIIAKANSTLEIDTVLGATLKETMDYLDAEAGLIHLIEGEGDAFTVVAAINIPHLQIPVAQQVSLGRGRCTMVQTMQCSRLARPSTMACELACEAIGKGSQSIVGIALVAKNRLIGIMHILQSVQHRYSSDEIEFFSTMGSQIGIVIEHARVFAELKWKSAELLRSHRLLEKNTGQLALSESRLRKNLALVEQANAEMERLDRMKSHFLGMVSHEFKTPLTGILGSVDFLLSNPGNLEEEEERLLLTIIRDGGARLNEVVTDLLKVARLESKGASIRNAPLHLKEILKLLLEQFAPLLRERNQQIVFEGVEALPYFSGDRECLGEVFTQLLENAVKFTPDGGVTVIAASVMDRAGLAERRKTLDRFNPGFYEQMGDAGYLQVEVRDSGVGVANEEQLKIFDTFYEIGDIRHHSSGKHKFMGKGAGLGLAIVKGLIEGHGGMVWVESGIPQSGSTFFLLIPLEEGAGQSLFPFMQDEGVTPPKALHGYAGKEEVDKAY